MTTGFQNLADAGLFGPPRNSAPIISAPSIGSGNVLADILSVGQFGLDVFSTVRGGGGGSAPSPAASVPVSAPSSSVPTPPGVTSRFVGNFAPGFAQASGSFPQGDQAAMVIGPSGALRVGVAFVLRKIKNFTGVRVTTKKIVQAIRQFGFNAVIVWAGVSLAELMVVWERGSRRVKRRFTKRDRSRGRSYIRHLKKSADELKSLGCGPRSVARRKRSC